MADFLTVLPTIILVDIFSRLPLNARFVWRCTCKAFRDLVSSNPDFMAAHASSAAQIKMLQFLRHNNLWGRLSLIEPDSDFALNTVPHLCEIWDVKGFSCSTILTEEDKLSLVNSCHGLLYFVRKDACDKGSVVCNPITNEYVLIPDIRVKRCIKTVSMWLGFCMRLNQYKVLRICKSEPDDWIFITCEPDDFVLEAKVLVVGSNLWIDVEGVVDRFDYQWNAPHVFFNGVMYWFDDHSRGAIVFFDFDLEKFGVISLPFDFEGPWLRNHIVGFAFENQLLRDQMLGFEFRQHELRNMTLERMNIGVLEGCVCLSYADLYAHRVDIWVLKRDGNQETWTKCLVVDYPPRHTMLNQVPHIMQLMRMAAVLSVARVKPLQVLRNGEILMLWFDNDLACYDPCNKSFRFVMLQQPGFCPNVVTLAPSFVPLEDTLKIGEASVKRMSLCREDVANLPEFDSIYKIKPKFFGYK